MSAEWKSNSPAVRKALEFGTQNAIMASGIEFQRQTKLQLSRSGSTRASGNRPSPPGSPPAVQTGHYRRSWQYGDTFSLFDQSNLHDRHRPRVRVGTRVPYGPIHEFGGVITAKGGALAVPIHRDAYGKSPRDFPDLFMVKRPGKAPLLYRRRSGRQAIVEEPMFVLLKSVRMPMRPHVRPARERTRALIPQIARREMAKALRMVRPHR